MQWTGPNGFSATGFTVTIENVTPEAAGDYVARGVGAGGCLGAADTVRVNVFAVPGLPTIRADEPVCEGGTLRLFAESDGATAYYWTGPNNWYSTEQNPIIESVDGRNHGSYQCRAIVGRCTSMVRTLGVYIEPLPPTPVILSNAPICDGDELRLRVDVAFGEYMWTAPNGQTYTGAEVVIANATTDYRGEWSLVSYSGNCTTQTQRTFVVIGEPNTPNPRPIGTVCEGQSVKIEMRPPIPAGGYRLYLNETDEGIILFRESLTTAPLYETVTYYIEPVVAGCNIERVPLTLNVDKVPFADMSALPDTSRTLFAPNISTVQFKDLSQFADSVHWDFGDGRTSTERNPKHTYTSAGRFTVTFTAYSPNGCADTLVYGPYDVLDENIVGIPSAFTPNGDGLNEKFELYVAGYPTYCLKVFNRWGFMVFDNKCEALNFWDGTDAFSGQTCIEGVYTYQFKAQDAAGRNVSFHGTITLIR
jgi:gliding motility-associated-like protein